MQALHDFNENWNPVAQIISGGYSALTERDFYNGNPRSRAGATTKFALGAIGLVTLGESNVEANAAKESGYVFWSANGDYAVKVAAREFAEKNGMQTLEMTSEGQALEQLTKGMSWGKAKPLWEAASANFASAAGNGTVHVFQSGVSGVGINSIWGNVEFSILKNNGANIIYHIP